MKAIARLRNNAGFTLIEVIVIVAILAILAGILAPMIFSQIDEAKLARAEADAKSISSAVLTFRKDLGVWPNLYGAGCTASTTLLHGEGALPAGLAAMAYSEDVKVLLNYVLMTDDEECYNPDLYKGPYLPVVTADPWGNAYIIAASNFDIDNRAAFVLSAGPNGTVETPIFAVATLGDDIGVRVK
jgi:general secretion pathway protein G